MFRVYEELPPGNTVELDPRLSGVFPALMLPSANHLHSCRGSESSVELVLLSTSAPGFS